MIQASHQPGEPDMTVAVDLRDALMRILRMLPPQQRAVIVLSYWEQLTQAETAVALPEAARAPWRRGHGHRR